MKILILGSEGFIGSHLCTHFVNLNNYVHGVDIFSNSNQFNYCYIKNTLAPTFWTDFFKKFKFDICINASGNGSVAHSVENPLFDFDANAISVFAILEGLKLFNSDCKYIHISSAAVYGNPQFLPIKESHKLQPISPYGFHKMISEILCKEYNQLFRIPLVILRPFSIFGNGLKKQLLWDICNMLSQNDNITLFGTGEESRDFIHITDFIFLIQRVIDNSSFNGDIYNAGSGVQITIKEVADIFLKYYNNKKSINFNNEKREADPINWEADITSLKSMGFEISKNFEIAIDDYINWFNQYNS